VPFAFLTPVDVKDLWEQLWLQDMIYDRALTGGNAIFFGDPTISSFYYGGDEQPKYGVYHTRKGTIVLCAGLANATQAIWLHYSWSQAREMADNQGYSGLTRRWAEHVYRNALFDKGLREDSVILVGHSGGCPTMESLAGYLHTRNPGALSAIITAGGPRTILSNYLTGIPNVERFRIMVPYDPVCYLPPHEEESPASWIAEYGLRTSANVAHIIGYPGVPNVGTSPELWQRIVHTPGGLLMYPDGTTVSTADPLVPANAIRDIVDWINPLVGDVRHSKTTYRTAIRAWAARWASLQPQPHSGAAPTVTIAAPVILPAPSPGPEVALPLYVVDRDLLKTLRLLEEQTVAATNPTSVVSQPDGSGGREYSVFLAGNQVATFPSSGRARTFARTLDKWLRRLPTANSVERDGLVVGLTTYLDQASVGNGITRALVPLE